MRQKNKTLLMPKGKILLTTLSALLILLTACVPEPTLEYPEPKQDFATYVEEPSTRSDATLADLDLDYGLDQGPAPDQGPMQPTLHTQSLDFVGEEQSTYNEIEPRVTGRYLWVSPDSVSQSKNDHPSPKNKD